MSDPQSPDPQLPNPPPPPSGNMLGCALFTIGALILIPSGLCTAAGVIMFVMEMFEDPQQLVTNLGDILPFAAMTLIPLAIGIALVWTAWRTRRQ